MSFLSSRTRRALISGSAAVFVPFAGTLALGAVGAPAASADPGGHGTLFVNNNGTASPTNADKSCATAAYSTVQSAIDAAAKDATVYLCGVSPYTESVVIQNKSIKLTGDPGATIQGNGAPTTNYFSSHSPALNTPNSVVTVIDSDNVKIDGLTVEGPFQNTDCAADDFGILQIGGKHLQVSNDTVQDIGAANPALAGCQYGVGIQIGREYWPDPTHTTFNVVDFVGDAQIQNTLVQRYQKNGITADGPGTEADIQSTTVDGGGQNAQIARNGIQISRGATGSVHDSSANNNEYTGPGGFASATGVLIFGGCGDPLSTGVDVHNNTLSNNDTGVSVSDFDPTCTTAPSSATNNQVHNNTISKGDGETNHSPFTDQLGNPYTGYQVGIGETGNKDDVHNNTITGTVVGNTDTAYGPQTAPGGPFLAPIDIQTYPPINTKVHNNTYDGSKTNPPY